MKTSLLSTFEPLLFFTIEGFRQLSGASAPIALSRWRKAGRILQLKKGVYMSRRFLEMHRGDEDFSGAVSAILLPQSYLSLEYVLQRRGLLTEVTYPVTAVTFKNTRTFTNDLGTFSYRHIQQPLYRGFAIREYQGIPFAQASAAKALFDLLYLRPLPMLALKDYDLAEDLRLNLDEMTLVERAEFSDYVSSSRLPKMSRLLAHLKETVWRH